MKLRILVTAILIASLFVLTGCSGGGSATDGVNLPTYPGATQDQAYDMGGMAEVKRFFTTDSYEDVLAFYERELAGYSPAVQSFELQDSRQTKIDVVDEDDRAVTVVIQEFEGDDRVAIVFMGITL